MKIFVAIAALVAVAVAFPNKPAYNQAAELEAIIAAINSPSTNPATAALLEEQLQEILNNDHNPVSVGPAVIDFPLPDGGAVSTPIETAPVSIGPAVIDFPLPDGGAVTAPAAPSPVAPSPVVIGPIAPGAPAPLVQLIVNVNPGAGVGVGGVAAKPERPNGPVDFVDVADNSAVEPVQVIDVTPVEVSPVQVVDTAPVVVDPVHVVDISPVIVDPIQIASPILPSPVVALPDELN